MDALSRKLEDTHDEIQRVRGEVVEALKAFYGGASSLSADEAMAIASRWSAPTHQRSSIPLLSQGSTAVGASGTASSEMDQRVDRLAHTLKDVVAQLQLDDSGSAQQTRLISSFAQRERLKRQMDQSRRMLVVVEKATHLDNALFDVDACMDKGDVTEAATASVRAQTLLAALEDLKQDAPSINSSSLAENNDIVRILQLQLLKKKNRLLHALNQTHTKMISSKQGVLRTKKPSFQFASALPGVSNLEACRVLWRASDLMEMLPSRLKEIASVVAQHLLKPLFACDGAFVKVSQEADGVSLTVITPGDGNTATPPSKRSEIDGMEHKCAQVVAVLRFLHSEVLASDAELMQRVTEHVWKAPGNLESQLLTLLQDKIPKETTAINAYRDAIARVIHDMGSALEEIGFLIPKNNQVRNFGNQINLLYAKKRRQQLLTEARSLMSRDYRNSTKVTAATERCNIDASLGSSKKDGGSKGGKMGSGGGSSSLVGGNASDEVENGSFQMPDYRITLCAHDVVELTHQTLIEACTPDSICANTLFHTSRDILFLFRAVVPTLHQSEIGNDASTCMLFHNDCMYIAHHMLIIGHLYKSRLPSPLSQMVTMVDMVPAFRETGERALAAYAKAMADELRNGTKTFQECGGVESDAALADLEQFLKSTLYKLNQINMAWHDGLPRGVFSQVMRSILQPFVASFLEQMLADKKIGASTAGKLHNLASLMLETQSVFPSPGQAEKHVPALAKLRRFTTLLVQPLATIQDQFVNGDLSEFTSNELSAVVRSIFRDSPERKELLRVVAMS